MICIDKGCAKRKRENNQLKNSDKMYHKSFASGHPQCDLNLFYHENDGVFIHEESYLS